jgi:hypothetical protein
MISPRRLVLLGALLATGPAASLAAQQPSDSILAAACAGGGSVADGILLVVFDGSVEPERRSAVAREVGGRAVGVAAEGGTYVALSPAGGLSPDAAADRLIRLEGVLSVGEAACPPPPPPPAPADTVAPGDTTAPATPPDTTRPTPGDSAAPAEPEAGPTPRDSVPAP